MNDDLWIAFAFLVLGAVDSIISAFDPNKSKLRTVLDVGTAFGFLLASSLIWNRL